MEPSRLGYRVVPTARAEDSSQEFILAQSSGRWVMEAPQTKLQKEGYYFQLLIPAPKSFETRVPWVTETWFPALTLGVGFCPREASVALVFIDPTPRHWSRAVNETEQVPALNELRLLWSEMTKTIKPMNTRHGEVAQ